MTDDSRTDQDGGVRRRQVLRTGAWAVPALVVAVPAPAFATSPTGIITVTGFKANTNQFNGQIAWSQFSISFNPNGGPDGVPASLDISITPGNTSTLGSSFSLFSGSPHQVGNGATAAQPPGTYRLVLTVTSNAAPTVVVQSDEVVLN